jgi:hypothetical protein
MVRSLDSSALRLRRSRSEAIITTPAPVITSVKAVLELVGGECALRHIEQGNWVIHFFFGGDAR